MNIKFKPPGVPIEAGMPGYNEYGVPLHACNGYIQDAHYWAWVGHLNRCAGRMSRLEREQREVWAKRPPVAQQRMIAAGLAPKWATTV